MKKKLVKRLLSGATALALVVSSILTDGFGVSRVKAASPVTKSGTWAVEADEVTLLAGKADRGVRGSDLAETLNNYEKKYLLGVAADFSVYLNDYFKVYDSDAEGRVAIGGDFINATMWDSYAIGLGDFSNKTRLEDLLDNNGFAHAIIGGSMEYVQHPDGDGWNNKDAHGGATSSGWGNPGDSHGKAYLTDAYYANGAKQESYVDKSISQKKLVIQNDANGDGSVDNNDYEAYVTNKNAPYNETTTNSKWDNGRINETSGPEWAKVDSTQTYFTTLLNFNDRFDFLSKRSQQMAEKTTPGTSVTYDADTDTITFKYDGPESELECVFFSISEDDWNNGFREATNVVFEGIPYLPDGPRYVTDNNAQTDVAWEYSYIIVNVAADGKGDSCTLRDHVDETVASSTGSNINHGNRNHIHVVDIENSDGSNNTSINGITISNTGSDITNNNPGVSSLMYNFYNAAGDEIVLGANFAGTIFAPGADVVDEWLYGYPGHGHLSGALIANSFEGATEFGYRPFDGPTTILVEIALDEIEVAKVDRDGDLLAGAEIGIYKYAYDGENYTKGDALYGGKSQTSSDTDTLIFKDLASGKYVLTEIEAPSGYTKAPEDIYFGISRRTIQATIPGHQAFYFNSHEVILTIYTDETFTDIKAEYTYSPLDIKFNTYVLDGKTYTFEVVDVKGDNTVEYIVSEDGEDITGTDADVFTLYAAKYTDKNGDGKEGYVVEYKYIDNSGQETTSTLEPTINLTQKLDGDLNLYDQNGFEIVNNKNIIIEKKAEYGIALPESVKVKFTLTAKDQTYDKLKDVKIKIDKGTAKNAFAKDAISTTFEGQKFEFEGLPDGVYTLEEVTPPDGFIKIESTFTITVEKGYITEVKPSNDNDKKYIDTTGLAENVIVVFNEQKIVKITFPFEKKVVDSEGADLTEALKKKYTFVLEEVDKDYKSFKPVKKIETDIIIDAGKFNFLPIKYKEAGIHYYKIYEEAGEDEDIKYDDTVYYVTVEVVEDGEGGLTVTTTPEDVNCVFTNTYSKTETATTELKVSKEWVGDGNAVNPRPTQVEVTVIGTAGEGTVTIPNNTVILNEKNNWAATFEDLPVENEDGIEIEYTVEEKAVPGYEPTYTKTADGYTITNTYTGEKAMTELKVSKKWVGDGNAVNPRPTQVEVTVTGTADGKTITIPNNTVILNEKNNWTATFEKLPVKDEDGIEIEYTVEEKAVPGYEPTYTKTADGYIITNTYTGEKAMTELKVSKKWVGDGNAVNPRPTQVEVTVTGKAGGKTVAIPNNTVILNGKNNWAATFEKLPVKNEDGIEIEYTVEEKAVPGYEPTYTKTADGYTITNTYTGEKAMTELKVSKKWVGDGNAVNPRPTQVEVTVIGTVKGKTITIRNNTVILNGKNNWTATFEKLPVKNEDGIEIEYTVEEKAVPGYEPTYTRTEDGYIITNQYIGEEVTTTEEEVTTTEEEVTTTEEEVTTTEEEVTTTEEEVTTTEEEVTTTEEEVTTTEEEVTTTEEEITTTEEEVTTTEEEVTTTEEEVTTTEEEVTTTEEESKKGGLIIVVTDEETGDRVSGATVTVTDSEGNSTDYVTDENGTITIEDLDEGDYDITVKEVPDGYTITTGETATVEVEAGKITVHEAYIIPSGSSSNNNNSNGNSTSQTQTGDAFNMILPVGMILVSLAGVAVIVIRRRKRY